MGEVSHSPEDKNPNKPKVEDEQDFGLDARDAERLWPELLEPDYLEIYQTDEELAVMDEWEEHNQGTLSKLSKPKQRKAYFDALRELRAQRAREQIHQARPDGDAQPDSGSAPGA